MVCHGVSKIFDLLSEKNISMGIAAKIFGINPPQPEGYYAAQKSQWQLPPEVKLNLGCSDPELTFNFRSTELREQMEVVSE